MNWLINLLFPPIFPKTKHPYARCLVCGGESHGLWKGSFTSETPPCIRYRESLLEYRRRKREMRELGIVANPPGRRIQSDIKHKFHCGRSECFHCEIMQGIYNPKPPCCSKMTCVDCDEWQGKPCMYCNRIVCEVCGDDWGEGNFHCNRLNCVRAHQTAANPDLEETV